MRSEQATLAPPGLEAADVGAPASGHSRAVFRTVTAAMAVESTVFSLVIPALPVFSNRYELSDSVASLIFAAFPIFQLITAVAIARGADGVGRRALLLSGGVLLLISTLAFAFADAAWLLILARAVQGVGAGMIWVAGVAAISDTYPQSELGFRLGLVQTAGGAVGLVGPLIGGPMIDAIGITGTFLAATAGIAATLVFALRRLPETRAGAMEPLPLVATFKSLLSEPSAKVGALSLALMGLVLAVIEPLLSLDLEQRLGVSSAGVGLVFGIGLITFFVTTPIAGRWSDRHGRSAPVLAGSLTVAAGLPFLGIGSVVTVTAAFVVVALGLAVMISSAGPLLMGAVDEAGFAGHYGFSAAALTAIFASGYAVGPLLGALGRVALPFSTLLLLLSIAVVVATFAIRRSGSA